MMKDDKLNLPRMENILPKDDIWLERRIKNRNFCRILIWIGNYVQKETEYIMIPQVRRAFDLSRQWSNEIIYDMQEHGLFAIKKIDTRYPEFYPTKKFWDYLKKILEIHKWNYD